MSSYLTIAGIPKKHKDEKIKLFSFSRNSEIYQRLNSYIPYAYKDDKEQWGDLTEEICNEAIDSLTEDIKSYKKQVKIYRQLGTFDDLQSALGLKDDIKEFKECRSLLYLLEDLVRNAKLELNGFDKLVANVD